MARTVRRKGFATTIQGYISKRLIKTRHDYEHDDWRLGRVAEGKEPQVSYDQYVKDTIHSFHLDKTDSIWRFERFWWSVPREVRKVSHKRQKRAHAHSIHVSVRSGDFDVVLDPRDSRELIGWWMYY